MQLMHNANGSKDEIAREEVLNEAKKTERRLSGTAYLFDI